jgi:hypothetical protein
LTLPTTTDTLVGRATTDTLTNKTLTSPTMTSPSFSTIVNTGTLTLPTTTDTLVGRTTTDTLTNKTLTSPTITSINNGGTVTIPSGVDTLVTLTATQTLTNKTLTSPVIGTIVNTGTLTLPTTTDTLVGRATTDTLTNKTLTLPTIASINNGGTVTIPSGADTLVTLTATQTLTNKTLTNPTVNGGALNGTVGATVASTGAFTTLSATGAVTFSPANANVTISPTGTGLVTINPATAGSINNVTIGATTAATVRGTTITATTAFSGPHNGTVGATTPNTGVFTSINGGQLAGMRNRIINGGMVIDQRNAGAAVTPAAPAFLTDRFYCEQTSTSALTFQQVADAPAGFVTSLKITVAASAAISAGTNNNLGQAIEGFNIVDFAWGTASAAAVTLSFWIKSSVIGTYSAHLRNAGDSYFYIATYSISVANTWEYKTITILGPTVGTWNTTNGRGILLNIVSLGNGSTYEGTAGSWQAGIKSATAGSIDFVAQANGSTLNVTGVQLELGSTATTFEQRSYGLELALCQRYTLVLPSGQFFGGGYLRTNQISSYGFISTPVSLRIAPSVSTSGTISAYCIDTQVNVNTFTVNSTTVNGIYIAPSFVSALGPAGYTFLLISSGPVIFSAEL